MIKKADMPRIETGVRNLDALLMGGLPKGSVSVISGPPGAGKTILTQQICFHNATPKHPVLYFNTLSEPTAKTLRYLKQFDFFDPTKLDGASQFVDLGIILHAKGLNETCKLVMDYVKKVKPSIVVIDSFKVFDDLARSKEELRKFDYEIAVNLMAWETTAFLLGEYGTHNIATNPLFSIVDGLILASQREESGEQLRLLQVVKMRGTNHSRDEHPFVITSHGVEVFAPRVTILREDRGSNEPRCKTGIAKLDELLGEGIPRGSSLLIGGVAGTGKTVLLLEFVYRGAQAGEKGIIFSFEETEERLRAAARGVGCDLDENIARGMIQIVFIPQPDIMLEKHLLMMRDHIEAMGAKRVAIDSVSVFLHKVKEAQIAREKTFQLASIIQNSQAVGFFATDIPYGSGQISRFGVEETVVDGIILLTSTEEGHERQRYLEVYKLRNTAHLEGRHILSITNSGVKIHPRYETEKRTVAHDGAEKKPAVHKASRAGVKRLKRGWTMTIQHRRKSHYGTSAERGLSRYGGEEHEVSLAHAHERLQHLYDISKLLIQFESVARTIPAVLALVTDTVPLRSAVLISDRTGHTQVLGWKTTGTSAIGLRFAKAHARAVYAYLGGVRATKDKRSSEKTGQRALLKTLAEELPAEMTAENKTNFVVLPLVVRRGRIFGTLQLEGRIQFNELDLLFMNDAVSQLAIVLDQAASDDTKRHETGKRRIHAQGLQKKYESQPGFPHAVIDGLGEGVVAVDLDEKVIVLNPAAEQLLGWTKREALGRPVHDILRIRRSDGSSIAVEEYPFMRALRTGGPCQGHDYLFSSRNVAMFPVSYTSSLFRREERILGAVLVFRNILEIKQSENKQRFLARFSAALSSSLDYRRTLDHVVHLSVPFLADLCFLDEVNEGGSVSRTVIAFADESKRPLTEPLRNATSKAGLQTPQTMVMRTCKGVLISAPPSSPFDDTAQPGDYDEIMRAIGVKSTLVMPLVVRGQMLGVLTFGVKKSKRYTSDDLALVEETLQRAAAALNNARVYQETQKAVQMRQDILASVSHDLRNPLNAILMGTDSLLLRSPAQDWRTGSRKIVELVKHSVERMDRLIKDLLDMSSIEAGHFSIRKEHHRVSTLAKDAIEELRPLAIQKSLHLDMRLPTEELYVFCDRERILQVLSNLLGNAIKFTAPEGTIVLRAESRRSHVCFTVTDTGPGISKEQIPHIFERYWQAAEAASRGTGLGLYITKGIVEAHGGITWVESAMGRGSSFFFTLPLSPLASASSTVQA